MPDSAKRLRYDPRTGPDRPAWLAAPEAERTLAVRKWLKSNDMPFPCCAPRNADEWREVEDQIASGFPPQTGKLMKQLLAAGLERIVAVWAMAETMSSPRYKQLERIAGPGDAPASLDIGRLFDDCDVSILPVAFEASAGGFGPAHQEVIDYYHRRYDPDGSMSFPVAAGFCFGCAASPKFVRNHTLYEHMYGNKIVDGTPVYLPVTDAYRELFRFVSDAVFEKDDPIPPSARPPVDPKACFESPFGDWCQGFAASRPVVAPGWESHLTGHPRLHAEYLAVVDTLLFFASHEEAHSVLDRSPGDESFTAATRRMHAGLADAIRRLFQLAHPITD